MHYSVPPHAEAKVVRCVKGAIYDVLLDLREGSPTYLHWVAETLSRDNGVALFVPEGVAHGFQTLEDETDVLYQMSEFFAPEGARGVAWNDPAFGIQSLGQRFVGSGSPVPCARAMKGRSDEQVTTDVVRA